MTGLRSTQLPTEAAVKTLPNVASRETAPPSGTPGRRSLLARCGMLACCIVMFLPIAGYLLSGGTIAGLLDNVALVVPLLACVGMHFVLHRLTGKSCHGGHYERDTPVRLSEPGETPGNGPTHWTDVIHTDRPIPPAAPSPTNRPSGRTFDRVGPERKCRNDSAGEPGKTGGIAEITK